MAEFMKNCVHFVVAQILVLSVHAVDNVGDGSLALKGAAAHLGQGGYRVLVEL